MYSTVRYNYMEARQCYYAKPFKVQLQKVRYLGWWPSLHDTNFTPFWSHVGCQLPHFPRAPSVFPNIALFSISYTSLHM
jgi:hypothetical protein